MHDLKPSLRAENAPENKTQQEHGQHLHLDSSEIEGAHDSVKPMEVTLQKAKTDIRDSDAYNATLLVGSLSSAGMLLHVYCHSTSSRFQVCVP